MTDEAFAEACDGTLEDLHTYATNIPICDLIEIAHAIGMRDEQRRKAAPRPAAPILRLVPKA